MNILSVTVTDQDSVQSNPKVKAGPLNSAVHQSKGTQNPFFPNPCILQHSPPQPFHPTAFVTLTLSSSTHSSPCLLSPALPPPLPFLLPLLCCQCSFLHTGCNTCLPSYTLTLLCVHADIVGRHAHVPAQR